MTTGLKTEGICLQDFADMCQGTIYNFNSKAIVKGLSIDSRNTYVGEAFIAIKGERFDGNKYIKSAMEKGASCAVVSTVDSSCTLPQILVEDTVEALCLFAKKYISLFKIKKVAITGSVGKTTTKQFTHAVLSTEFNTLKTEGNYNSEIGLPLTIANLDNSFESAVFEMGMSGLGEISKLSQIVNPDISIITNIGYSHLEYLHTRDNILKAKMEIIDGMKEGSSLLLNGDNEYLLKADSKNVNKIYYGLSDNCDYQAINIRMNNTSTLYDVRFQNKIIKDCKINCYGKEHVYDSLAAVVCGKLLNISDESIKKGLLNYCPGKMRKNLHKTENFTIIEDCYNACPESMESALDFLCNAFSSRKVAIVGDMKELGDNTHILHYNVGKTAAEMGVELLFAIGDYSEQIKNGALENGMDSSFIRTYSSTEEFINNYSEIRKQLKKDDAILLKASRAMQLEKISVLL